MLQGTGAVFSHWTNDKNSYLFKEVAVNYIFLHWQVFPPIIVIVHRAASLLTLIRFLANAAAWRQTPVWIQPLQSNWAPLQRVSKSSRKNAEVRSDRLAFTQMQHSLTGYETSGPEAGLFNGYLLVGCWSLLDSWLLFLDLCKFCRKV